MKAKPYEDRKLVRLSKATVVSDARFLYDLRTAPEAAQWFPGAGDFTFDDHLAFLYELVSCEDRMQWTMWVGDARAGYLRADKRRTNDAAKLIENSFECSAIVHPDHRRKGYLRWMQQVALPMVFEIWPQMTWNVGSIQFANIACIKSMEGLGKRLLYKKSDEEGVWAISRAEVMRWVDGG